MLSLVETAEMLKSVTVPVKLHARCHAVRLSIKFRP